MHWKIKEQNTDMRLSRTPQPFLNALIRRPYSLLDGLMFIYRNSYWRKAKEVIHTFITGAGWQNKWRQKNWNYRCQKPKCMLRQNGIQSVSQRSLELLTAGEFVRKLKQRRRRRRESNRFRLAKQQLCTCSTLFGTFLCRRGCTTTTCTAKTTDNFLFFFVSYLDIVF